MLTNNVAKIEVPLYLVPLELVTKQRQRKGGGGGKKEGRKEAFHMEGEEEQVALHT